jgi:hypothetical protein
MYYGTPPIVTSGLVLALDAANRQSYISGSTTWNNLSRSQLSGSLLGVTNYISSYNGAISTTGFPSYIRTNYTPSNTDFTVSLPYVCTNFSPWAGLWACEVWNNKTGFLAYFDSSTQLRFTTGGNSGGITVNTSSSLLQYYTFTLSGGSTGSIYVNGILASTGTMLTSSAIEKPIILSTRYSNDGTSITDTKPAIIPQLQIYNRALIQAEVLQNYNATKTRFGLT